MGCLDETMPLVDFLFGNETEAQTWADCSGWECTVVITQGKDPTIVACNGHVRLFEINALAPEKIVDTNGAGDAYVGGFLAALSKGLDMEKCCQAGAYSAS